MLRSRNWARAGLGQWHINFRLFRFSGTLGQPREVYLNFQKNLYIYIYIYKVTFHSIPHPEFPEFLVEWKEPHDCSFVVI